MDAVIFVKFICMFYFSCQFQWSLTFSEPVKNLKQCKFSAIFNFGDSNSDTGIKAHSPSPNYSSFSENPPDRFSDGRLAIDFIASNLTSSLLNPYLYEFNGTNYMNGANFAVGGATTTKYQNEVSLDEELKNFVQLVNKYDQLSSKKGLMPKQEYFSQALYMIDIGQNDFGWRLKEPNVNVEKLKALVPQSVDAIVRHVKALYAIGARYFWIHNTGPVGCLPNIFDNEDLPLSDQKDEFGCVIPYNNLDQDFNKKLKESIINLRATLPLAAITYVDIYLIKHSLLTQPKKYGFSPQINDTCGGGRPGECAIKAFYDSVHLTEAANKVIYNLIFTGNFSDPPIMPKLACNQLS